MFDVASINCQFRCYWPQSRFELGSSIFWFERFFIVHNVIFHVKENIQYKKSCVKVLADITSTFERVFLQNVQRIRAKKSFCIVDIFFVFCTKTCSRTSQCTSHWYIKIYFHEKRRHSTCKSIWSARFQLKIHLHVQVRMSRKLAVCHFLRILLVENPNFISKSKTILRNHRKFRTFWGLSYTKYMLRSFVGLLFVHKRHIKCSYF